MQKTVSHMDSFCKHKTKIHFKYFSAFYFLQIPLYANLYSFVDKPLWSGSGHFKVFQTVLVKLLGHAVPKLIWISAQNMEGVVVEFRPGAADRSVNTVQTN